METKILTIPGYGGSGAHHWQSIWENEIDNTERVEQKDWDNPQLQLWVDTLNSFIKNDQKYILVGHSLACSLIAHWALQYDSSSISGALLVSASDVDSADYTPEAVQCFSPMPTNKLHFKSILVASDDDPYVAIERAEYFAEQWGSEFINIGSHGHINADANLGSWLYGKHLLRRLMNTV